MAFPTVTADTESGSQGTNSNSWTLTYPANISAGDLLLLAVGVDGSPTVSSIPSGWTAVGAGRFVNGTSCGLFLYYKRADGTETGNFTLGLSATEQGVWRIWRITGVHGTSNPEVGTATTGASANPDPPNLDPAGWATEDTLWFAICGHDDGRASCTTEPTNYTNLFGDASGGSGGAGLGTARRENAVSAENPGPFTKTGTGSTAAWVAQTVAIRPAGVQTIQRTFTGSIGSAGTLQRQVQKNQLAGITPSAGLITSKMTSRSYSGSIGSGGTLGLLKAVGRSYAGTIASAGILIKQPYRTFAGSFASAGSLIRQATKIFDGTITSAGILSNFRPPVTRFLEVAGTITSTGAVTFLKSLLRTFTGTITSTGVLTRSTIKTFVGVIASVGDLSNFRLPATRFLEVAGTITSAGTLANLKVALRTYAGSIASAGVLVKETGRTLVGTITSAGTLLRQTTKTFTGTIGSTSTLANQKIQNVIERTFTGAIATSGALTRNTMQQFTGAITSGGTLVRRTQRQFAGAIASTASLIIERLPLVKAIELSGIIDSSGNLARRASRTMTGTLATSGALTRQASRMFSGAITSAGSLTRQFQAVFQGVIDSAGTLTTEVIAVVLGARRFIRMHSRQFMQNAVTRVRSASKMISDRYDD